VTAGIRKGGFQILRAVEVLERIGDAEARQLLERVASGAEASWQTREAKAALNRLTALSSPGR
jgi:hypothetical protein